MTLRHWTRWVTLAACLILAATGQAATFDRASTPRVEATFAAEHTRVPAGGDSSLLLHLDILEHWHTYWAFPGESGEETRIEFELPDGVTVGAMQWPTPQRIPFGPVVNYGYEGSADHLLTLSLDDDLAEGTVLPLTAHARWLVCKEECIPEEASFSIRLEVGPAQAAADSPADFAAARERLPLASPWPLEQPAADRLRIPGEFDAEVLSHAYFFADTWGRIQPSAGQSFEVSDGALELRYTPGPAPGPLAGVLTLVERIDGQEQRHGFAFTANGTAMPAATVEGISEAAAGLGLLLALALAFAGGILLNLMPCVFPVLSVKLLALTQHAHGEATALRRAGYAYSAGVLCCFGLIAVVLLLLRAGGEAIGWGFQLQEPWVIAALALLFFWLGLALSGWVEIGNRLMGVAGQHSGRGGDFGTGLLAAVVATPCTAPFMGAAVGWAVLQPAAVAMSVLLALGAGMAAPFLALCFAPGLLRRLPRPGPWMIRLKEALAFPLYASAIWLVWVLARQAGPDAVALVLLCMLLLALTIWLSRQTPALRGAPVAGLILAAGLAIAMLPGLSTRPEAAVQATTVNATRIAELRAAGQPVFLNLTAAWCVTCLVNERVALRTDTVRQAFDAHGVTYLEGDWTDRDPEITALLEEFGRAGVPLYVIYPPTGTPRVLPQVLTPALVVDALQETLGEARGPVADTTFPAPLPGGAS